MTQSKHQPGKQGKEKMVEDDILYSFLVLGIQLGVGCCGEDGTLDKLKSRGNKAKGAMVQKKMGDRGRRMRKIKD